MPDRLPEVRKDFCQHPARAAAAAAGLALGLWLTVLPARAAVPQVAQHELACGEAFPCPPEMRRRVDFWIQVFRSWRTDQLVFHDRERPWRVYSVITSEHTCHGPRTDRSVEAERDRIRGILRTLARKVTWAEPGWTGQERFYLQLFPERDPAVIREAAERVRCQTGNRDRFRQALRRFGAYERDIREVLEQHDLSEDLLYLPFVESAYNPEAYSRAGAAGLWQIMPATARKLGLQLDATLDERFDPQPATRAAAKYLRHATEVLTGIAREMDPSIDAAQVNPFVVTSYNYGVSGMARAIRSVGPDYIEVLNEYNSQSFRTAVRNFYASFLAARHVARNANKYFGRIEPEGGQALSRVVLKRSTSVDRLVEVLEVPRETLEDMNPALTRYVWEGWRLIPQGYTLRLPARSDGWRAGVARLESLPPEAPQPSGRKYLVQRGDTACEIARAFAVECRDLIQLNGLGRRALIRAGDKLDIPGDPKPTAAERVAAAEAGRYEVRRGDTACEIAASFEVECRELIRMNDLGSRAIIHIGRELRIPGDRLVGARPDGNAGTAGAGDAVASELMEEVDVAVKSTPADGGTRYRTRVLPAETLGHYADWLGLGGTRELRETNEIPFGSELRVDRLVTLPIADDSQRLAFEASRFEFHQTLVDEFTQHYRITGVEEYKVKAGDTLWRIAARHDLPYWVLSRSNRGVEAPDIGQTLRVPTVRARNASNQPLVETME